MDSTILQSWWEPWGALVPARTLAGQRVPLCWHGFGVWLLFLHVPKDNFFFSLHSKCRLCLELSNYRDTYTCCSSLLCFPGDHHTFQAAVPAQQSPCLLHKIQDAFYLFRPASTSQIFFFYHVFFFCKEKSDSGRKSMSCGEEEEGKEKGVEETNLTRAYPIWREDLPRSAVEGRGKVTMEQWVRESAFSETKSFQK